MNVLYRYFQYGVICLFRQLFFPTIIFSSNEPEIKPNYCRKVFATYLRNRGIESHITDLLP